MSSYEDRESKRLKQEKAALEDFRKKKLNECYRELFDNKAFTIVMRDILARGEMFQSVMTGNSATYYKSGRQDYAKEIFATMASVNADAAFNLLKPEEVK